MVMRDRTRREARGQLLGQVTRSDLAGWSASAGQGTSSDPPSAGQLQTSPFRSWEFDVAAFVLFRDNDYAVRRGALVPLEVVRSQASFRKHVNGSVVMMRSALLDHEDADDITHGLLTLLLTLSSYWV